MLTWGRILQPVRGQVGWQQHFQMYTVARRQREIVQNRKNNFALFPFVTKIFNLETGARSQECPCVESGKDWGDRGIGLNMGPSLPITWAFVKYTNLSTTSLEIMV